MLALQSGKSGELENSRPAPLDNIRNSIYLVEYRHSGAIRRILPTPTTGSFCDLTFFKHKRLRPKWSERRRLMQFILYQSSLNSLRSEVRLVDIGKQEERAGRDVKMPEVGVSRQGRRGEANRDFEP